VLFQAVSALGAVGISSDRVLFQAVSALGAVGLSMDLTGPNRPEPAKFVEILMMLLGRLEIIALVLLPPVLAGKLRMSAAERGESGAATSS
jgi:Trk-type K+ transport system membrane component